MRHFRLMILAVLLTLEGRAMADNLTVGTVTLNAGGTKQMIIGLNNPTNKYAAFQFDLVLPEGISIAKNDNGKLIASLNEDRKDDHTLTVSDLGNNTYRFLTFSMTNAEFYGKDGALVNLTLRADEGISSDNKTAIIQSQVFTEVNGTQYKWSDINFTIKVSVEIIVTAPTAKTGLIYTGSAQELITAGSSSAGEMQYSLDGTNYSTTIPTGTDAKTYTVYYKVKGDANHNDTAPSTLAATIIKAPLTITAKSYTIKQGEDLPTFEATYSGFKNNENSSALTVLPTFYCSATSESVPGTYDITVSDAVAANYDITYVKGTLTVTPGTYTMTYIVDGEVYKTVSYEYGITITPEVGPTKEGYTFSGWSEIPATMPANDVTITGSFTINKYKLTYIVDGVEYKSYEIEYGTSITPEAEPTKEGYTFSGWSDVPSNMPAEDVTVIGTFAINSYTLTYILDGEEYKTLTVEYGSDIIPEEDPTKEGYTFSGWSEIPEKMPAHDVIIIGSYIKGTFNLIYQVDGETYKTISYDFGDIIVPENAPTKKGYTFSGWEGLPETMPASDITVIGTFTINSYTLTYLLDGEEYKSFEMEYGTAITSETEPTKEGYTFSGWSEIPEKMPAEDVIVIGTFTINSYTLTYLLDGEEYKTISVEYGSDIYAEKEPVKEGYTFSGWSEIPESMPAENVMVFGTFTINSYTLTYILDGEEYKAYTIEYASSITAENTPEKEGYTFSGWSYVPSKMPAENVTVTGTFIINRYTISYIIDGEVFYTESIDYGSEIVPPSVPERSGYNFAWEDYPETVPANDITIKGQYVPQKYILTYILDGEEYKSVEITYGSEIQPEELPEREGYTFSGWDGFPEKMPAEDVTVVGRFTINSYTLTYILDGEEYKTVSVEYGLNIDSVVPEREGYTFSGWDGLPETMPAENITVTGTFAINSYTLTYILDGKEYKAYAIEYGSSITAENTPEKEGYTFSGWSYVPSKMPAENVTVTGTFIINRYTISYIIDGEVFYTESIDYGSEIVPPTVPERSGYDFAWEDYPETVPANDVIIYGSYTTGIARIMADRNVEGIYSMDGKRLSHPQHGVNIIRMKDGKVKRVMVK